jgi:cell division transport system permease protein
MIKEGFLGFSRARIAVTISIISMALSLSMIGGFFIAIQNLSELFKKFYKKPQIEIYINNALDKEQIAQLKTKILSYNFVDSLTYISPGEALQEFEADFGEDLVKVLDENPLPPTFRAVLKAEYSEIGKIDNVATNLRAVQGVDDVVFQKNLITLINRYFIGGLLISISIGTVIFIITTLLIFNTIRLTIYARKTIIEIMRLVGATNYFIKGPFVMEGVIQGIIGSLFACFLLLIVGNVITTFLFSDLFIPLYFYFLLIAAGTFLGLLGSYFSVSKFLKYE